MSFKLPLYRQAKDNTCALACLRMVLAAFGTHVEESVLEGRAYMQLEGLMITELERPCREFHLTARIQEGPVEQLQDILAAGELPIAYIDRAIFELSPERRRTHSIRNAIIHTVIPVRVTADWVVFHDPRVSRVARRTLRLFRRAYEGLAGYSVVCSKPASS